jgi:hypothetical protein
LYFPLIAAPILLRRDATHTSSSAVSTRMQSSTEQGPGAASANLRTPPRDADTPGCQTSALSCVLSSERVDNFAPDQVSDLEAAVPVAGPPSICRRDHSGGHARGRLTAQHGPDPGAFGCGSRRLRTPCVDASCTAGTRAARWHSGSCIDSDGPIAHHICRITAGTAGHVASAECRPGCSRTRRGGQQNGNIRNCRDRNEG